MAVKKHSHRKWSNYWGSRQATLKGGLKRVVIRQLRMLGIVGFPIPKYDAQTGTWQMQKQTASGWNSASARYLSHIQSGATIGGHAKWSPRL